MEFQKPITLLDAVTLLEQNNGDDGYLVGGIAEKGTQNDSLVAPVVFQDSASIIDDESVLEDTAEGLLVKNVVLYRAMVLDYGGKKIFKPPEEVKKSLITIPRMMVCDDHPPARLITNASEITGCPTIERIDLIYLLNIIRIVSIACDKLTIQLYHIITVLIIWYLLNLLKTRPGYSLQQLKT